MTYESKSDVVAAGLREAIITGELTGGTPLRQRDIAHSFDMSPTPVREALRRLEAEGLVRYDLHRGATVIDGTFGASDENYRIRAALESLAARLAAVRIAEEDLQELEEIHLELSACKRGDPRVTELNQRFHFRIYEASRSPILLALLRLLWQSFPKGPQVVRPLRDSVRQHRAILDALAAGDEDSVEDLTREHILGALSHLDKRRAPRRGARAAVSRPSR